MTVKHRTQVGIVGAGPAGLLLSHLLALGGVDSIVIETRSRAYCEARQRAGMLESTTVELLRAVGLGRRLNAEGLEHDGIYLQFAGERHHVNFRELTGGRSVTIYAQTEIVKDLIRARTADRAALEFEVSETEVADLDSDHPVLRYTDSAGQRHEVTCDAIAGCDGFHGICRPAIPRGGLRLVAERSYPYGWLGILAKAPPSTDEVIYCRHEDGFALHSMRTPERSSVLWASTVCTYAAGPPVRHTRGTPHTSPPARKASAAIEIARSRSPGGRRRATSSGTPARGSAGPPRSGSGRASPRPSRSSSPPSPCSRPPASERGMSPSRRGTRSLDRRG